MGYYTNHEITVHGFKTEDDVRHVSDAMREIGIIGYAVDDTATVLSPYYYCHDMVKWYEEIDDMTSLSLKFPDLTFMVSGDGEDSLDFWKHYYQNGEFENCNGHLTFDKPEKIKWEMLDYD